MSIKIQLTNAANNRYCCEVIGEKLFFFGNDPEALVNRASAALAALGLMLNSIEVVSGRNNNYSNPAMTMAKEHHRHG